MHEEDAPTVISSQAGMRAEVAADPADDWLSDASDLDWFDDPGGAPRPRPAAQAGTAATAPSHEEPPPVDDLIRRRRAIALLAGLAVIVAVVLVWLLVIDAGGSNTPAPTTPATTPANTTPAESTTPATTTTTPATTTTTTTPVTGGTITVTLPAAGKMKPGDTSPEVKTLQEALSQLGTAQLKADGIYGPLTQQAVTAFQQANGLTVDGIVGTQTAAALNTALAAQG
jgi:hypothetical protein